MGFGDSFKTGVTGFLGGFSDFLTDITGAAMAAAPTLIPLLQTTGVIPFRQGPQLQPMPTRTALPGGAVVQFPSIPRVPPQIRAIPGLAPTGPFPTGAPTQASFAPSGVVPMPQFQATRAGFQQAVSLPSLDVPFLDIVGQGGGATLSRLTSPFVPTMAGARAQPFISPNPVTGALTWFKPAGKPILWSGDLTACRRVGRIAMRARRARGKR